MASIAGVVLAGGQGTRLGGAIKAHLRAGNETLVVRALRVLRQQAGPVAVSIGHFEASQFAGLGDLALLSDLENVDIGPVGGLAAAVAWCGTLDPVPGFLLTTAVDTPFVPLDFATRAMAEMHPETAGVVASCAGQLHPTHALWRFSELRSLEVEAATDTAPKSLRTLAYQLEAKILEYEPTDGRDPFRSINTPADLEAAARDLGEHG